MTDVRDTQQLHVITGRAPATIRLVCRHLRGDGGYAYPDALETLDANPDDPAVVTAAEAGQMPGIGIPANRIYQWVHVGLLRPIDHDGRSPLYLVDDLVRLRNRLDRKAQLDL